MRSACGLRLGDDGIVRVSTSDSTSSLTLRVAASNRSPVVVSTPDPHIAQVWIAKAGSTWLVSINESDLARELLEGRDRLSAVINSGAVSARFELGHSMFIPTVLDEARALPAGVECTLDDRGLDEALLTMRNSLAPSKISISHMIEKLVASYRDALAGSREAFLLISAGWDSRLETVLLREALGSGGSMHMLHLYTSDEELEIVTALANQTGSTLVVVDPALFSAIGLQWQTLAEELATEATWRPTIPMYSAAVALTTSQCWDMPRFGLVPYALKGRQRSEPITETPPDRGKYRVREPNTPVLDFGECVATVTAQQLTMWHALTRLTDGWPHGARRDHLDWVLRYGFSLGHRARTTSPLLSVSPIVFREHFQDFVGLPEDARVENDLIITIIRRLAPELYQVPIVSSGGDGNLHSGASGADVNLNWKSDRLPVETKVGVSPLAWSGAKVSVGPGSPYTDGFAALCAMARTRTTEPIPLQLLSEGLHRGGNTLVNGYQLATFLSGVVADRPGAD